LWDPFSELLALRFTSNKHKCYNSTSFSTKFHDVSKTHAFSTFCRKLQTIEVKKFETKTVSSSYKTLKLHNCFSFLTVICIFFVSNRSYKKMVFL
jgi:hypothetical protein